MQDKEILQEAINRYGEDAQIDMAIEWATIEKFPNYEVSNRGDIFSKRNNRLIKLRNTKLNYKNVGFLVSLKKHKNFLVHRLVAEAFIPNPDNKPFINHIDCNPSNNYVSNLEWCTQKENIQHAIKLGRIDKKGTKNHNVIINDEQVLYVKKLILEGVKDTEIGKITGVKMKTVFDIRVGKSWSFLTGFNPYSDYIKRENRTEINIPYGNSRYSVKSIIEIKTLLNSGVSRADTARRVGVPSHLVGDIIAKKSWNHIIINDI